MNSGKHNPSNSIDWVIIGGGIHGVHLAVRLIAEAGADPSRMRIVDPAPGLLHEWLRCSTNTGMEYLRSPAVHHLDVEPFSLLKFANATDIQKRDELFAPPYNRPSVKLFNAHCDDVVSRFGLRDLHIRDAVTDVSLSADGVQIQLRGDQTLTAQRVILAIGASGHPRWPDWTGELLMAGLKIHHIFEPGFQLNPHEWPQKVAIIGGGLTAAQAALRLAGGSRQVHIISRHNIREHQFDSDPGWIGPKYMRGFLTIKSRTARRKKIQSARHVGSMPADIHKQLRIQMKKGAIHWHTGDVSASIIDTGAVFKVGKGYVPADGVLLATGFETARPGGKLLDRMVDQYALPCSTCGFPLTDIHLRWHPRIFVTGPLAELEIGPVSRNIAGARRAADRIVPFTLKETGALQGQEVIYPSNADRMS